MVVTSTNENKYINELLSEEDLGIVEDLILLLEPFLEMTKLISGSKYVTASIVLPAITRLLECLMLYEPINGIKNLLIHFILFFMKIDLNEIFFIQAMISLKK